MAAELTQERLREVLRYFPSLGLWRWRTSKGGRAFGGMAGSVRPDGRRQIRVDGKSYLASRLAVFYQTGSWPEHDVDHEDLNPRNDRWHNLRPATRAQNLTNRRAFGKTAPKGVTTIGNRHYARIGIGGKLVYLGVFDRVEDASACYLEAAKIHYGEFARA